MPLRFACALVAFLLAANAAAQDACGDLQNAFGPFDVRTIAAGDLAMVETAHFTPEVEALRRGNTGQVAGDIDYTLRAIPNHPRALRAIDMLGRRMKSERLPGAKYNVHCYFERALRFRPDDGTARLLYGIYLLARGAQPQAIEQLELAQKSLGDDPNVHYNLGLAFFEAKRYPEALKHAHEAYRLGYPLPGLRTRLQQAGQWREPAPSAPPAESKQAE